MLAPVLKAAGYRVRVAPNAQEGLAALRSGQAFTSWNLSAMMSPSNGFMMYSLAPASSARGCAPDRSRPCRTPPPARRRPARRSFLRNSMPFITGMFQSSRIASGIAARTGQRLHAVGGLGDLVADVLEDPPRHLADHPTVIDDKTGLHFSLCFFGIPRGHFHCTFIWRSACRWCYAASKAGTSSRTRSTSSTTMSWPSRRWTPPASLAMRGSRLTGFSSRPSWASLSTSPIWSIRRP